MKTSPGFWPWHYVAMLDEMEADERACVEAVRRGGSLSIDDVSPPFEDVRLPTCYLQE